MSVISIQAVAKRFGDRLVFSDVSFQLAHGDRAGLIGPNGLGKTTLLRIAAGLETADAGNVAVARGARLGFLQQELLVDLPGTVEEHARGAAAHLRELEEELRALETRLAEANHGDALERYADVQHRFDHAGGYDFDWTVRRVLAGLGLDELTAREVRTLSGGERTRLGLARLLLDDPDVLLLDEPTNHLDLAAVEWLETFLVERELTVLAASHDRWFLDRVTSRTLSFERRTVVQYRGAYSHYARQRAEREESQGRAAARQAEEIERTQDFIDRNRAGQRSKEARGRAKKLARLERIVEPERAAGHGWRLEAAHLAGDLVVETTPLAAGHGDRVVVRTPALRVERGARIAVAGPNGAGKTTLVRTVVGELPVLGGYVSAAPTARVAFLTQAQAELSGDGTVLDTLRAAGGLSEQGARDLLARFLFRGDDVFKAVGVLSGGERSRLALARLAAREANLLVLDEPTNHLDLAAREALEHVLSEYQGTIVVVTHDRYLIDKLATEVWLVDRGVLRSYEGNWSALQRARREQPTGEAAGSLDGAGARESGAQAEATSRRDPRARATPQPSGTPARAPGAPRGGRASSAPDPASADRSRRSSRRASPVRKVEGFRALEARIQSMELQLRQLQRRVGDIAQQGNYMETRRVGEEYAALERSLRELYEEWASQGEGQR